MWLVERDGGFPELYGYVKMLLATLLLLHLYVRRRGVVYLGWFTALLFVLLDDAFQLHEAFGNALLAKYALPTLLGVDGFLYVEAILWGAVGLSLANLIVYRYLRDPATRALSRRMFGLFLLLFLFAGIADALHASVDRFGSGLSYALGITTTLEDGGEMLALSLVLAYVFNYYKRALRVSGSPSTASDGKPRTYSHPK